jgi:hypothetical protein
MSERGPTFRVRSARVLDSDPRLDEVRVEVGVDSGKFFIFSMDHQTARRLAAALVVELES